MLRRILLITSDRPMKAYFVEATDPLDAKTRFQRGEAVLTAVDIDHLLKVDSWDMPKKKIVEGMDKIAQGVTPISKAKRKKNAQKERRL